MYVLGVEVLARGPVEVVYVLDVEVMAVGAVERGEVVYVLGVEVLAGDQVYIRFERGSYGRGSNTGGAHFGGIGGHQLQLYGYDSFSQMSAFSVCLYIMHNYV